MVFRVNATSERSNSESQGDVTFETPKVSLPVSSSPWGPPKNEDSVRSRERIEAPLFPTLPRPACERFELHFSCDAIFVRLRGSCLIRFRSIYHGSAMCPQEILVEHVVDIHRFLADFRDALERIQSSSSQSYGVNKYSFLDNHLCRNRSAFTIGTLGPDEVREMLSRNKLQESGILLPCKRRPIVMNTIFHELFHVAHSAGCAILFDEDIFHFDISVKSIYLHDTRRGVQDHIVEGEQGWVLHGVLSRACFRRAAASGETVFTVLSLHINNVYAKKRGTAKIIIQAVRSLMISHDIDLVGG